MWGGCLKAEVLVAPAVGLLDLGEVEILEVTDFRQDTIRVVTEVADDVEGGAERVHDDVIADLIGLDLPVGGDHGAQGVVAGAVHFDSDSVRGHGPEPVHVVVEGELGVAGVDREGDLVGVDQVGVVRDERDDVFTGLVGVHRHALAVRVFVAERDAVLEVESSCDAITVDVRGRADLDARLVGHGIVVIRGVVIVIHGIVVARGLRASHHQGGRERGHENVPVLHHDLFSFKEWRPQERRVAATPTHSE